MTKAEKIRDLRRKEKALAVADRLIHQIVTQAMSLNSFTQEMDELFEANNDLTEIWDARRDPWQEGTKVFDTLKAVRAQLHHLGAQI